MRARMRARRMEDDQKGLGGGLSDGRGQWSLANAHSLRPLRVRCSLALALPPPKPPRGRIFASLSHTSLRSATARAALSRGTDAFAALRFVWGAPLRCPRSTGESGVRPRYAPAPPFLSATACRGAVVARLRSLPASASRPLLACDRSAPSQTPTRGHLRFATPYFVTLRYGTHRSIARH